MSASKGLSLTACFVGLFVLIALGHEIPASFVAGLWVLAAVTLPVGNFIALFFVMGLGAFLSPEPTTLYLLPFALVGLIAARLSRRKPLIALERYSFFLFVGFWFSIGLVTTATRLQSLSGFDLLGRMIGASILAFGSSPIYVKLTYQDKFLKEMLHTFQCCVPKLRRSPVVVDLRDSNRKRFGSFILDDPTRLKKLSYFP